MRNETIKRKSKKTLFISLGLLAIVIFFLGQKLIMDNGETDYLSESASKELIETYYTFSGNVASSNTQNVMSKNIIQISEVHVKEGASVEADTLLFTATDGTELRSTIKGTINKIFIEVDQQVLSGTPVAEIIDFDNLQITIKVDEYDLDAIEIDKKIDVTIGALDKSIDGTISDISRTAINQNGVSYFTAVVKLDYDNEIKVGMTAEAKILNKQSTDAISIPIKALSFDTENNPYVYIKDDQGNMVKTSVVIGINDGYNVEIEKGIRSGQTVYYLDTNAKNQSNNTMPAMPGAPSGNAN